jgi:hypothetical protein
VPTLPLAAATSGDLFLIMTEDDKKLATDGDFKLCENNPAPQNATDDFWDI